jgi:hypothetical protein
MDLTTQTLVYQNPHTRYGEEFQFDFGNHHLYRWVASGLALSPPAGDPYADYRMYFYDRVTGEDAELASAPVPEPTSIALFASGVAASLLGGRRRRRVRATEAGRRASVDDRVESPD